MLNQIKINKFLYLKNIEVELSNRLNVFTGESGVGKSLIIDAISFVLGEKGNYEDGDYVELVFELENQFSEDGILILAREIKNGKSFYYLNGRKVGKSLIDDISKEVIEIHGQHSNQKLFNLDYHREIYDKFLKIDDKLKTFQNLYQQYIKLKKEYEDIISKKSENQRKIDFLNFQINELQQANIRAGEKQKLEEEYKYLSNLSDIREILEYSKSALSANDISVLPILSQVIKQFNKIKDINQDLENIYSNLEEAKALIENTFYMIENFDVNLDPYKLQEVEDRLNLINSLERKYNTSADKLNSLLENLKIELESLISIEDNIPILEKNLKTLEENVLSLANEISQIRKSKIKEFEDLVVEGLRDIGFKSANFKVSIEEKLLDKYGIDKIIFLFSANAGYEPKILSDVASGGEISRLSLILKLISKKSVDTLIFDEIDTGIGGKAAIEMAKKLKELSKDFQVILVTHLPQIAVVGDKHFYIDKIDLDGKTIAIVNNLNQENRIGEIARMLSGIVNKESINLAKQLLLEGEKWIK